LEKAKKLAPLLDALQSRCQLSPNLPGFDVVVDLVVLVSSADGAIDEAERRALYQTIQALSGGRLKEEQLEQEIAACVEFLSVKGPEAQAKRLGEALAAIGAQEEGLRLGAAIAYVSRGYSVEERSALLHVADAAGISVEQLGLWAREIRQLVTPE
jgi:tellurite resistance protein